MSSISVSGSGQRAFSFHGNGGQHTQVGLSPKAGDDMQISFYSLGSLEFSVTPESLRLEKRQKTDDEGKVSTYLVVVVKSESATGLTAMCRNNAQNNLTPGMGVRVQDEIEKQFIEGLETVESKTGIEIYPELSS